MLTTNPSFVTNDMIVSAAAAPVLTEVDVACDA